MSPLEQTPTFGQIFVDANRADDRRDALRVRNDLFERFFAMLDDVRVLKPILRGVAVRHNFGKND